jgi:hypothetical protein
LKSFVWSRFDNRHQITKKGTQLDKQHELECIFDPKSNTLKYVSTKSGLKVKEIKKIVEKIFLNSMIQKIDGRHHLCDFDLGLILPSAKAEKNPVFCIYREI